MTVLCLCNHGNTRSVALAYLIKTIYKHDVLTGGVEENSDETLKMLFNWSDKIIALTPEAKNKVVELGWDAESLYVGDDVWHNPFAQELQHKLLKNLKELDL